METQHEDTGHARRGGGMILGKFLPPHRGHQWLIDFASAYCEHLTVLVCTLDREPIPGQLRYQWVQEMCPNVRCVHVTEDLPQEPQEHPDFWDIWRQTIRNSVGHPIDYVFASEDYGWKLAEVLGTEYVPVDHARQIVPISGSEIRSKPMKNWNYLPEAVRPYFLKRVCLFGPESTGKSTLASELAQHFQTKYVWEYARPLLDFQGGQATPTDIERIARGQIASETAIARHANRVLFCDTDLLTTTIWSEVLFGTSPDWIREEAGNRRYDLYLLLDIDVPWVDDQQRFFAEPEERRTFFDRCRSTLDKHKIDYITLSGSWDERRAAAYRAVEQLLLDA